MSLHNYLRVLYVLLFFETNSVSGQETNEVRFKSDEDRIENLIIKSEDFWHENTDSAIYYAKIAINELNHFNDSLYKDRRRRKASEQELSELNRSKDQLLSIIGHDLRGPMGGIETLLDMMSKGDLSKEEIQTIAPSAIESLSQARNLLEDLLQWGVHQLKSKSVELSNIQLRELVEEVFSTVAVMADSKNNKLINEVPSEIVIRSDRNILSFILRNLLQNSIKFTHKGAIRVRGVDGGRVSIFVEDEGVGMTEPEVNRILRGEAFSSSGTHGEQVTGLGMSLIREFTNTLGGELNIGSEKNQRTSTELRLNH